MWLRFASVPGLLPFRLIAPSQPLAPECPSHQPQSTSIDGSREPSASAFTELSDVKQAEGAGRVTSCWLPCLTRNSQRHPPLPRSTFSSLRLTRFSSERFRSRLFLGRSSAFSRK